MGRVLKRNITVRPTLTSPFHTFLAGEELPEEFAHLVGEHVFSDKETIPSFKRVSRKKTGLPSLPEEKQEKKELTVPAKNGSKPSWQAFLKEAGVAFPEDASREDLIDIASKALPELNI